MINLNEVESRERFDRVTVKVKVQEIINKETLSDGSVKQDALVTDSSGLLKISVWGDCVNTLKKNVSYRLANLW